MRSSTLRLSLAACVVAATFGSVQLFADDAKKDAKPATQPAMMDQAAMMAAWQKYATPGKEHADLAKWEGEWVTEMEDLTPGMGGEKSHGTASARMIMGGRVLQEDFKGTTMGMPFEGMALTGYDNISRQYWSTWVDSMGTGLMASYGDMKGEKMDMKGDMSCPMQDKPAKAHYTITFSGDDKRVMDMTMTAADGSPLGVMRITYTRKK